MLMKLFSDRRGEFFAFIIEAYLAYLIAEKLHISGILTLITAIIASKAWIDLDIAMHNKKKEEEIQDENRLIDDIQEDIDASKVEVKTKIKLRHRLRLYHIHATSTERLEYIYDMAKEFGYIATVLIFFVLAEMVDFKTLWHYRTEIITMFLLTTLIRAISTGLFTFIGKRFQAIEHVGIEGWFILTFSGMKGALSIILVHMIPNTFKYKELFEAVTVGVVSLSIFIYGIVLWGYFTYKRLKKS
jgi:CPA1 family monovalent cation:H+ antiporter